MVMVGRCAHFGPRIRDTPLKLWWWIGPSSGAVGRREKPVIYFIQGTAVWRWTRNEMLPRDLYTTLHNDQTHTTYISPTSVISCSMPPKMCVWVEKMVLHVYMPKKMVFFFAFKLAFLIMQCMSSKLHWQKIVFRSFCLCFPLHWVRAAARPPLCLIFIIQFEAYPRTHRICARCYAMLISDCPLT